MESPICRVCLVSDKSMVNVFEASHEPGLSIADVITKCTGCQVEEEDPLPNTICMSCLEDAENAFEIIETYERSHQFYCFFKDVREEESENEGSCCSEEVESAGGDGQGKNGSDDDVDSRGNNLEAVDDNIGFEPDINKNRKAKEKPSFSCSYCPKTYQARSSLSVHMRSHTGERPFKCSLCPKAFGYNCVLQGHMRTHTGERPYKCSQCSKTFTFAHNLKAHMHIHERGETHRCSYCLKGFLTFSVLKQHLATHLDKQFQCSQCSKAFPNEHELKMHMRDHPERLFKCSHCSKDFQLKAYLKRHMLKHVGCSQGSKQLFRHNS
ncbi:uncharacterized protein Dere_GG13232 [Drosophila erecta]|uniref:Protein krueppel n=2 Tax=Drosophila erecta TaxID=7220 RepID=B3NE92_DROER|nr:uncharacterized protein Dere_GG13232 [Drosophila erecta]